MFGAGTLWYFSRSAGAISLLLLTFTTMLGILGSRKIPLPGLTAAGVQRLHRTFTGLTVVFVALHVSAAIVDGYVELHVIDAFVPLASQYDPLWIGLGAVAVDLIIAMAVTGIFRRHLSYRAWKGLHYATYALFPIAAVHAITVGGGDPSQPWMITTVAVGVAGIAGCLALSARHPASNVPLRTR